MKRTRSVEFWPPAKEIARLFKVDITTARRWRRGAICPPLQVAQILDGDLGLFGQQWRLWRVIGGEIYAPGGWAIRREDVLAVPLLHGQISALRHDLAAAKKRIVELESRPSESDQPMPDSWNLQHMKL